ncbi:MAG: hypothetical protein C4533_05315 [Candidatus Omnitrophota bacterium]|nr:MAG: hypothetical protein C4533_05315 [Candidatus Omnitrophota bacterium]
MEDKSKFIIIGLIGLLVVSLFFSLQINAAKGSVEKQRDELQKENAALNKKIDVTVQEARRLEDRASTLSRDLDKISKQKDDLQKRFEMLNRERDALVDKLKEQVQAPKAPAAAPAMISAGSAMEESYWASVIKSNADIKLQLENSRNELRTVQIKNEELQRLKTSLELEIKNLNRDKDELQKQLAYNQKIVDNISVELATEKTSKFQMQDSLQAIKGENVTLRRRLEALDSMKIDLENKLQDVTTQKENLERKFGNMESTLQSKVDEICRLKEKLGQITDVSVKDISSSKSAIDLSPIIVKPQSDSKSMVSITSAARPASLEARVLVVNRDDNFVVVDAGQDAGLRAGDTFKIYRQGNQIGSVRVIQLRNDVAACDIQNESTPIKVGDIAK